MKSTPSTTNLILMKTPQQKLSQVKRIMKALMLRGQNNEKINAIYKNLLKK